VWSCGGAFTTGSGAFVEEDPAKLAARGAVVVSFNIRLNIFGFFAHAALSAESVHGSSGNYGLHDQAAALKWVRENICGFNGDPGRITFFGESAGATVGMLLLTSPVARNLYDRAIFQSPGSFSVLLSLEEAEQHGAALGATVEQMRSIPAGELLQRAKQLAAVQPSLWLARPLRPIADGWFIDSERPLSVGNFAAVPTIIGSNEEEGRFFAARMAIKTVDGFDSFVHSVFGDHAREALARYPVTSDRDVPTMFSAVYGDRAFNYPIDRLARAFALSAADVYRCVYTYRHGETDRPPTHSEENGVLLDVLPHVRPEDAEMADIMGRYWLNFADTGNPNGSGLLAWPKYAQTTDLYLRLDVPLSIGSKWRSDYVEFVATNAVDP
jgi:para-nitrobenzyl esterase